VHGFTVTLANLPHSPGFGTRGLILAERRATGSVVRFGGRIGLVLCAGECCITCAHIVSEFYEGGWASAGVSRWLAHP
jgi:hypothetical protein